MPPPSSVSAPAREPRARVAALPGVFRPRSDTGLLAAVMHELDAARGATVLDVCAGTGVLAIAAALDGADGVTAVDLSRRAVATVRRNARRNGVRVRALRGDLFAPVADERFDLIVANPPYLPGGPTPPRAGAARAWDGGPGGRALVDRLCDGTRRMLTPRGRLLLVHSSLTGERATLERLANAGLDAVVLTRRRGPLGPLGSRAAAAAPPPGRTDATAPPPRADGPGTEELVVFAAVRAA